MEKRMERSLIYNGTITAEQFLFYEIRIASKYYLDGTSVEDAIEEIKKNNQLEAALHKIEKEKDILDKEEKDAFLEELGVENTPMIYVYNKVDLNKYGYVHPVAPYVFISAKEKIGLDLLEDEISHILFKDYETFQLGIPYDKGEDFKYLYEHTYVEQVDYRDDYIYLQIEAKRQDIKDYLMYILLN